jgi:uncharacterized protein
MPHVPVIDGFEFARSGARKSGDWRVEDFPRLRDELYAAEGTLHYSLQGLAEEQGRPALRMKVEGTLQLKCQRCLGPLDFDLCSEAQLLLFEDELELAALAVDAEGPECIVAQREMRVLDLVEDEVLLALPIAPRHEQCRPREGDAPAAQQRPFAGLRALIGGRR